MVGNVFMQSLQQLGQWLTQQNQGTGSGTGNLVSPTNGASQPSKVVTQVHYAQPPTQTSTNVGTPAVSTTPPAPQVSTFAPPQGGAQAIPQPGGVKVPQAGGANQPQQPQGGGTGIPGIASVGANVGTGGSGSYTP